MPEQAIATSHPKLIYFAERHADMDAAAFRARWRQHARLGMSMPRWKNIRRYAHCDAFAVPDSLLPAADCDGVGLVWYRDETRRLKHVADSSAAPVMKQDEAETFARPVREVAVLADEFVLQTEKNAAYKIFLQIWRNPMLTPADFRSWWLGEAGRRPGQKLVELKSIRGYTQNHARLATGEQVPPPLCDCVDEIACDNIADCELMLNEMLARLGEFGDHIQDYKAVWTRETVLHDAR